MTAQPLTDPAVPMADRPHRQPVTAGQAVDRTARRPDAAGDVIRRALAMRNDPSVDLSAVVIPEGLTDEDRAETRARQQAVKVKRWQARLPRRYAASRFARLHPQQDPTGKDVDGLGVQQVPHAVSTFLDSDRLTLLLAGDSRRGKTDAAYAVGNEAVDRGVHTLAWQWGDLLAALPYRPGDDDPTWGAVTECPLLVLDDVGRENPDVVVKEVLQRLLDARLRQNLRTIITTNLGYPEIVERYGDPVAERMVERGRVVKVEGETLGGLGEGSASLW